MGDEEFIAIGGSVGVLEIEGETKVEVEEVAVKVFGVVSIGTEVVEVLATEGSVELGVPALSSFMRAAFMSCQLVEASGHPFPDPRKFCRVMMESSNLANLERVELSVGNPCIGTFVLFTALPFSRLSPRAYVCLSTMQSMSIGVKLP